MGRAWSLDGYQNLVAGLGTQRNKEFFGGYGLTSTPALLEQQLVTAYEESWLAGKIVDIPAEDATRKWRLWNAAKDQITAIEEEENRLEARFKTEEAISAARLYGGASFYMGIAGQAPAAPIDLEAVGLGDLEYLTLFSPSELRPGEIDKDIASPYFNTPSYYTIADIDVRVHPSKLVVFRGAKVPLARRRVTPSWGESVLRRCFDAVLKADATTANVAALVFEAKLDIVGIPELTELLLVKENEKRILDRFALANLAKSNSNIILLDKEEEWEQKTFNFSGLPEILDRMFQNVSGAADIPVTRFFGKPAIGFNATGEHDLKNYYDHIAAIQQNRLRPAMRLFDEVLLRSALGSRPPEIFYEWASLWQVPEEEQAKIRVSIAETAVKLSSSKVYAGENGQKFLRKATLNAFIESGTMPGIEDAAAEFDPLLDETLDPQLIQPVKQETPSDGNSKL